jgi:Mycothiol maleylpyruvate isomerase N-terminal domain
MADGLDERHLAVCRRFGESVRAANGRWERPSPCDAWDARGVLEHVIGFHDVLLLRPLGLKPNRPRDDPQRRWELTYDQLEMAFESDIGPDATAVVPARKTPPEAWVDAGLTALAEGGPDAIRIESLFLGNSLIAAEHDGRSRREVIDDALAYLLSPSR